MKSQEELIRSRGYWIANIQMDLFKYVDEYMRKHEKNIEANSPLGFTLPSEAVIKSRLAGYKSADDDKKRTFDLTVDEVKLLISESRCHCKYCRCCRWCT